MINKNIELLEVLHLTLNPNYILNKKDKLLFDQFKEINLERCKIKQYVVLIIFQILKK